MKGNEKISLTAEMVAFIKSQEKDDKYNKYFTTSKVKRIYKIISLIFPKRKIKEIFDKRRILSEDIRKIVEYYKPQQIIELASGSSTYGLEYSQKHPKVVYLETDLEKVISNKKEIIKRIQNAEKLKVHNNHILIKLDVLSDDIYTKTNKYIKKDKKTLIFAEGLTTYLDNIQYELFLNNINKALTKIPNSAYLSHEPFGKSITSGFAGKIIRSIISILTKSRRHLHFKTEKELKENLKRLNLKEIKKINSESGNYIYLVNKI